MNLLIFLYWRHTSTTNGWTLSMTYNTMLKYAIKPEMYLLKQDEDE